MNFAEIPHIFDLFRFQVMVGWEAGGGVWPLFIYLLVSIVLWNRNIWKFCVVGLGDDLWRGKLDVLTAEGHALFDYWTINFSTMCALLQRFYITESIEGITMDISTQPRKKKPPSEGDDFYGRPIALTPIIKSLYQISRFIINIVKYIRVFYFYFGRCLKKSTIIGFYTFRGFMSVDSIKIWAISGRN